MSSILESTRNTRSILTDNLKYIRSDVPYNITDKDTKWLLSQNICTIVDLREPEESLQKRCPLIDNENFEYHCMPVTGGNKIPKSADDVSKSYINMVDENMTQIIDTIVNAKTNVLYFCNAGKDRTGVVSAILLRRLGKNDEYIISDYMKSKDNLTELLENFVRQYPEVDINVITPQERYMGEFLEWLSR